MEGLAAAGPPLVGGICPHDDHLYSARVTVHLSQRLAAPRVVLIGVFHKARLWHEEGRMVFDTFRAWHGPWGPVPVDPLRQELLASLDSGSWVASNTMHCREHSLEGILPFLQHHHRDLTIVPILIPYLEWQRLEELSADLANALGQAMKRHGWELGRDLAVVISNDAVHYGADFDHAPFGTDAHAYLEATARDRRLIADHLEGTIRPAALQQLLHTLVNQDDVHRYRIPWCGRFSVPFGVMVLGQLAVELGLPPPQGRLLRYGTTLSEPELAVAAASRAAGLGYTAPSNLHHWVGFMSVGYSLPR
jgi:AmmeMemoRadiSam system protein B